MRFLRYFLKLFRDLFAFSWRRKIWWIIPLVAVLLLLMLLVIAGETSAPFIYTLF